MLFGRLLIFFKTNFLEYHQYHQSVKLCVNSLDPDQARRFVRPDLGPNCLENYQAYDNTCSMLMKRKHSN